MKKLFIVFLLVCIAATNFGQSRDEADSVRRRAAKPVVTARFIPDSIAIGDHFCLRLEVTKDIVQQIGFPAVDTADMKFTELLEIIEEKAPDTVKIDNRRITIGKEYVLTTFKAGVQYLKHIPVLYLDKNISDTIWAMPDSIMLQVGTFEIDTLKQTIYDIKAPMQTPVVLGEFSGYLFFGIILIAFIAGITWLLMQMRKNKTVFWKRRPEEAPHVAAIRALEALHHQKLWQNNKHKAYYSLLTDIIRTYIEGRFGVQAMEMTSDELIAAMAPIEMDESSRKRLSSLLYVADLAKFAKYAPSAEENEASYDDAYYFVENTKPVETLNPEEK